MTYYLYKVNGIYFMTYYLYKVNGIYHVNIQLFVEAKFYQQTDPDPH